MSDQPRVGPGQRNHDMSDGCVPSHIEITPCGRGEDSDACGGCNCGLEARQVQRLRAELDRTQQERDQYQAEAASYAQLDPVVTDLTVDLAAARAERDQVEEANTTLSAQNTGMVGELNEAEAALTRARAELVAWDESWRGTQHVERLEAELAEARADVERMQVQLTDALDEIRRLLTTRPARPEPDPPGGP